MPKLTVGVQKREDYSFLESVRRRFIEEFTRIKQRYELSNMILVLDLECARYISSLFTVTQLVGQGVVFIQRLEKVRKTLDHHAIYFITPTEASVQCMLADFKSEQECRYRKVHVLFSSTLDRKFMKKISANQIFLKKLARHSFKEFYFELSALSDNCVHLCIDYLSLAFSRESNEQLEARVKISRRFVDLVASYSELKVVRIYYERSANQVAERVAERAGKEIKDYLIQLLENKSAAVREDASDVTIYITDRSIDIITPLIHGYAYEALLYDIVNISDQEGQGQDPNKLKGSIFDEFRYRHIFHALQSLPNRLKELVDKISDSQKLEAIDIMHLQEQKEELEVHIQLLRRLWEKFEKKGLGEVGEIELRLATGITEEGKETSSSELFDTVLKIIKNSVNLTPQEILRLAMLTAICIKLTKTDYETLLALFNEEQKTALANLAIFGLRPDKKISKSTKAIDKIIMDRARAKLENHALVSERFTCALEMILPRLIEFLRGGSQRGKADKKMMEEIVVSVTSEQERPKFDDKKVICFMCGGLSQTQICSIRKDPSLSNVLLASDSILIPNKFMQQITKIDLLSKNAQS